jgi:excisionase family DNA binding protein
MEPATEVVPSPTVSPQELPLTVRQAAVYLGVSSQTVYLWVERKQIPHLRVMGRNIRFLKPDLEQFRAGLGLLTIPDDATRAVN